MTARVSALALLAGMAGGLLGCDAQESGASVAQAATQLRIAPARGIDEEGQDLIQAAYEQAASSAQQAGGDAGALIGSDAAAAKAQASFRRATDAWAGLSEASATGQAMLVRLAGERTRLETLQSFDPSPARAEIAGRRASLQEELRGVEATLDTLRGRIAEIEARIADLRSRSAQQRDAGESQREQGASAPPVRRAEFIARANEFQRQADQLSRQASEVELELQSAMFERQAGEEALAAVRRRLETLMQGERALEAEVALRSQQAGTARESIASLTQRLEELIGTMAERYNAEVAPALDEAIAGFDAAASRARQATATGGGAARLAAASSEHSLASLHRAHAGMLGAMLEFVERAIAAGVTAGPVTEIRDALRAKRSEAASAADQAAAQASASLGGAGVGGAAGEAIAAVAELLNPTPASTGGEQDGSERGMGDAAGDEVGGMPPVDPPIDPDSDPSADPGR